MRGPLALGVVGALLTVGAAVQDQRPVFRAASRIVAVPVSVQDGNTPVRGLTAADFELRDNGVVQPVEFVADGDAPIDLTFVVDGSPSLVYEYSTSLPQDVLNFRRDLERLPELLAPGDRLRVLAFDSWLQELVPWTSAGDVPVIKPIGSAGSRTLNDAIAASMMAGPADGRRRMVAVLIKSPDLASAVDTSRVIELAGQTDATLYTYLLDSGGPARVMPGAMDSGGNMRSTIISGGRLPSAFGSSVALPRWAAERIQALEHAAERTGGRPLDYKNSAFDSLRDLLGEFRDTYVLFFSPSDRSRAWHELSVAVRRPGAARYTVRARTSYDAAPTPADVGAGARPVVTPEAAPPVRSTVAGPEAPGSAASIAITAVSLPSLLERYDSGDHDAVVADLLDATNGGEVEELLRREGERWIEAAAADGKARRRTVAAALALEIARPTRSLSGSRQSAPRALTWRQGRTLVYWGAGLLADNLRVTEAERAWYLAAIASFQGMLQFRQQMEGFQDAPDLVDQAIARDPDEPRHRWTRANVLEYWLETFGRVGRVRPDDVQEAYDAATSRADDDLRAEMQLHLVSRFLAANRDTDEALGPIVDAARREAAKEVLARTAFAEGLADDPFLVYMCRFFRGRLHDRLDERAEAEAAYRSALDIYPRAQSASLALASLRYLRGERSSAVELVNSSLASETIEDPWRLYSLQDYRRLPMYIEQMRAALQAGR